MRWYYINYISSMQWYYIYYIYKHLLLWSSFNFFKHKSIEVIFIGGIGLFFLSSPRPESEIHSTPHQKITAPTHWLVPTTNIPSSCTQAYKLLHPVFLCVPGIFLPEKNISFLTWPATSTRPHHRHATHRRRLVQAGRPQAHYPFLVQLMWRPSSHWPFPQAQLRGKANPVVPH